MDPVSIAVSCAMSAAFAGAIGLLLKIHLEKLRVRRKQLELEIELTKRGR